MDEILKLTLLYDFYGELLTEKQKEVFEFHYHSDLSLTEIGEVLSITRQAVRDQLKRTEKILLEYEEKLQLVERFGEQQKAVKELKAILEELTDGKIKNEMHPSFCKIKEIVEKLY